jgi:hypothetical protein
MGADGATGHLKLELLARHLPPSPYLAAALSKLSIDTAIGTGDADRVYFVEDESIAGGATTNVDLQVITDVYGSAVTATEVVALAIVAGSANPDDIHIQPGAATAWIGLIEAGSVINLRPGNAVFFSGMGTSLVVAAGSKILSLVNQDGAVAGTFSLLVVTKD